MSIKTIIWDYNGTIIDDVGLCLKIENYMLEERHMKHDWTLEQYRNLFGFPVKNYYKKIGYTFEKESYEDISVEFNELYDQYFDTLTLCEGFEEKIQEAIHQDWQNVIISASREDKLKAQCRMLGIDSYFTEIMGTSNLLAGSKVDMAKKWMKNSLIQSDDCIYIGDTDHDAETAVAIGVSKCILVASGHQSRSVLEKTGQTVVNSLKEVVL